MEAHVLLKALSLGLFYTYEDSTYLGILIIWQGLDFSWGMGTSFQLGAYILIWRRLFVCVCMYARVCFNFDEMGLGCLRCFNVSHYCLGLWSGCLFFLFGLYIERTHLFFLFLYSSLIDFIFASHRAWMRKTS